MELLIGSKLKQLRRERSLTQEEVMTRCRGNEPCSVTYTVREGVLMKVALCE